MAWRTVLPLILTVAGLATVGATCLFQKCQKDRNMVQLKEDFMKQRSSTPKVSRSRQDRYVPSTQGIDVEPCMKSPMCTLKHGMDGRGLPRT